MSVLHTVILAPDATAKSAVMLACALSEPRLQSTAGEYAWVHWGWSPELLSDAAACKGENDAPVLVFSADRDWKAERGWVDQTVEGE